jgi:D-amino peptidase
MRIAIWADMEGASGLSDIRMCSPSLPDYYSKGQKLITGDINAVIEGVRKITSAEIDVWDGHGGGGNILPDELLKGVEYVKRGGYRLFETAMTGEIVGMYDALVMVGMHAMTGTQDGFYSHTNMSHLAMKVNGVFTGEIAQTAWFFARGGTPSVMVAGDDATAREAEAFLPGVETVVVKDSVSRADTTCLPLPKARQRIKSAASAVIKNLSVFKVHPPPAPVTLEIMFSEEKMAYDARRRLPRMNYVDDRTVRYECDEIIEALKMYQLTMQLSASTTSEIMGRLSKLNGADEVMRVWAEERYANNLQTVPPFPVVKY